MISTKERAIGANTYKVTQLGFKKSREVLARLSKMLGPVLAELLSSGSSKDKAGAALAAICAQVSESDLEYLCSVFSECTFVTLPDGTLKKLNDQTQEALFGGQIMECFKWLAFCLEANYADFFVEFKDLAEPPRVAKDPA